MYSIGVDIGGTKIAIGALNEDYHFLYEHTIPTNADEGYDVILSRIKREITLVLEKYSGDRCIGIGIGAPGPLNSKKGIIKSPPNLPGWDDVPLLDDIQKAFSLPVFIENDANVSALAEYKFGAGRSSKTMAYLTVSTGIGGGFILDGELFHGVSGNAGEIGHTIIHPSGPKCNCGSKGCLEALASGTAISNRAFEKFGEKMSAKEVAEKAAAGDQTCEEILNEAFAYLGMAISNVIKTFNPDFIVIGGGLANLKKRLLQPIENVLIEHVPDVFRQDVRIAIAQLGSSAGIKGAAYLPFQNDIGGNIHEITSISDQTV